MHPQKDNRSPSQGIDVHCHIFNASDLPVTQFVRQVLLVDYPRLGDLLEPAIAFFVFLIDSGAPNAQQEIDKLNEIHSGRVSLKAFLAGRKRRRKAIEKQIVTDALQRLWDGDIESTTNGTPLAIDLATSTKRGFVRKLYREAFPRARSVGTPDLEKLADQLALGGVGLAGLVPWILSFTNYRFEILDELAHFSPPAENDIGLYVPATVDYAYWLGEFDTTPMTQQAEVMLKISLLKDLGYSMHGYIAFDPGRQALLERPETPDPVITNAIQAQKFLGVKLYPPMGFRSIGNADIPDSWFPKNLEAKLKPGIGKKIDDALLVLYRWCIDKDVPIMTHCGYSNYARPGYGERAAPSYWRDLLEYQPSRGSYPFRNLRLNLGHSGGLKAFAEKDSNSSDWLPTVIDMLNEVKYPNLYADVAFDEIALARTRKEKCQNDYVKKFLKNTFEKKTNAARKIMYGSDWIMLGYQDKNAEYYEDMKKCFGEVFGSKELLDGFLGRNAARFLRLP